ncbi:unnamed protein product, partial [Anisakis simplex]|uniref:SAM domain-containing protein n=1 Tax=Anisakis simplex TaxID=6269 RepID=A0A0M3JN64_ANISI
MSMGMIGQMGGAMVSTNDGGGGGSLLQRRGVHVPAPVAPHHHGGGGSSLLAPVSAPIPPASSPPPIPLEEFLTRLTLCHCLGQLRAAGVHSVSDLMKMSQIDLLSYGLIADEAQRIRDALNRPLSSTLQRQTSSQHNNGSSLRLMHSPSIPLRADSRQ